MPISILLTDVTEMQGANYCVAGWDTKNGRMIRPLPNGTNWTIAHLGKHKIAPGNYIQVAATGAALPAAFPHKTEDMIVAADTVTATNGPKPVWSGKGAPLIAATLMAAFDKHLQHNSVWNGARKGVYVAEGTKTKSLVAVELPCDQIDFFEDVFNGKKTLRAILEDDEDKYNLPVVSRELRELYRAKGAGAVTKAMPSKGKVHVRVGLARAWQGQPGKCFAMLNGVLW